MSFFSFLFKKKFPNAPTRANLFSGPLTLSRVLFYMLAATFVCFLYFALIALNDRVLITVPARGGSLTEGIIGAPRFINPVLAATETDVALTNLVYAGLMKQYGDGTLVPALAAEYHVSPDGRTYTFILRDKLFFHDHSALTSSDVAFTIEKLQDPALNPRSASLWEMVSISTPDEKTIIATLPAPDPTFLQRMTVGILPFELWHGIPSDAFAGAALNLSPIGAGAFKVRSVLFDESNAPKKMTLVRFRQYALDTPLLKTVAISVFANQESLLGALTSGAIDLTFDLDSESIPDHTLPKQITATALPTTTRVALWRQDGSGPLENAALLATINRFIDKTSILATVENGYGIPDSFSQEPAEESLEDTPPESLPTAQAALEKLGYSVHNGVLTNGGTAVVLSIATESTPAFLTIARALSGQLAALGIVTDIQAFNPGTFQDELARGTFPFVLTDSTTALPASYSISIPLYTSALIAAADTTAHNITQSALGSPPLRYATISDWHRRTDRIYPFLQSFISLNH